MTSAAGTHNPEPTRKIEPIVVPLAAPEHLEAIGPVALSYADALGVDVEIVTVIYPEDDERAEFDRFTAAIDAFAHEHDRVLDFRLVVNEGLLDGVIEACIDRWTCMRTSGSVFDEHHYTGSFASSLLEKATKPVILVGPNVRDDRLDPSRVFVARSSTTHNSSGCAAGEEVAALFSLPISTVTVDAKGIVYEADYDDEHLDRPDEVHAGMRPGPMSDHDVIETLAAFADRGILVVTSRARQNLASICTPSVSLGAAKFAHAPIVALGPNLVLGGKN